MMFSNIAPSYWRLRDYLWNSIPEARAAIVDLEQADVDAERAIDDISPYSYLSEVFMWGVFTPAAERGDKVVLGRCFELVENMLGTDDSLLVECVGIRVVEKIHYSARLVEEARTMAGPLLRRKLAEDTEDNSWVAP